jgi:hypothetical protein
MGRSNLAATNLDKVLSSGINNCRLFVVAAVVPGALAGVLSPDSVALARSRKEKDCYVRTSDASTYLAERVWTLEFCDINHRHRVA